MGPSLHTQLCKIKSCPGNPSWAPEILTVSHNSSGPGILKTSLDVTGPVLSFPSLLHCSGAFGAVPWWRSLPLTKKWRAQAKLWATQSLVVHWCVKWGAGGNPSPASFNVLWNEKWGAWTLLDPSSYCAVDCFSRETIKILIGTLHVLCNCQPFYHLGYVGTGNGPTTSCSPWL